MSVLNETVIRALADKTNVPILCRGYVNSWPLCQWNLMKWEAVFGKKEYPFRCINKFVQSKDPCWERICAVKLMSFEEFAQAVCSSDDAMYFDYKYLHEWFSASDELHQAISWARLGYPEKGPADVTLWVGSDGAHTPAHQDTYGVNIVTQVFGKKHWILFPPDSGGLQPSRVPYEESSIYSGINFYCPVDTQVFKELTGARVVDLMPGDVLIVPHKWWHYVQNVDPINISLNMWLPHENDDLARMSEAVVKLFVTQLCKDLPSEEVKLLVNPTEDDLVDTPLSVLLSQLQVVTSQCNNKSIKEHPKKRQKTSNDRVSTLDPTNTPIDYDLKALVDNPNNKLEIPPIITGKELVQVIENTMSKYKDFLKAPQNNEQVEISTSVRTLRNLINAFCQENVVDQCKKNMMACST